MEIQEIIKQFSKVIQLEWEIWLIFVLLVNQVIQQLLSMRPIHMSKLNVQEFRIVLVLIGSIIVLCVQVVMHIYIQILKFIMIGVQAIEAANVWQQVQEVSVLLVERVIN